MPTQFKDYYAILGVPRNATEEQIKKAFRKLARQYHPDVAKDKKGAEEKFKDINEAYEVLGDLANRQKYDRLGMEWDRAAAAPGGPQGFQGFGAESDGEPHVEFHFDGTGFSDFFEELFGRRSRYGTSFRSSGAQTAGEERAVRGSDIEGDILVTVEEVMRGAIRPISLQRVDPRSGETVTESFKVRIPPGVQQNRTIRVPGHGGEGIGGASRGDLYLRVHFAAHPDFRVNGADLYYDLDLAPWEAVLGTTVSIPSLDGTLNGKVPPGIDNGEKVRLRRRGLPQGPKAERGDLYLVVNIRVPRKVSDKERRLWEELRSVSAFDPRRED
jgi:curved DNA-binding protein